MIICLIILISLILFIQYISLRYSIEIINDLKTFFISLFIVFSLNLKFLSINFTLISILFFYIYFCFIITTPGIKNLGPSLILIKIIHKNFNLNKKQIRHIFLKEKFLSKRIKENFNKKLIYHKKNKIRLTKKGEIIFKFFNKVTKTFKLIADVK